jgi:hypothetical protein
MKMAKPDFEKLKAAIESQDTEVRRAAYRRGEFPRADKVNDLNTRYRWDLLWDAGGLRRVLDVEHNYNDRHIDTALRKIVSPL